MPIAPPSSDSAQWNPDAAMAFMRDADDAETAELLDPQCDVRLFDKVYQLAGYAQDYLEIEFSFKKNAAGALSVTLPGDTECRDHIFNDNDIEAVIPIIVDTAGSQWTGQVDTASLIVDEDGVETIELTALHDWEWCSHVAMWPSPFAPLEIQFPKHMIGIGPSATIIKTFYKANLLRLQLPLWRIPSLSELFKPSAWFNVGNANFPVAVMPINLLDDTSKWCAVSARMQTGSELFEQVLKDGGLSLTATVWDPEEHGQPAPGHFTITRPTVVLDVEDHSGVTGPTGTVIDGMLWWITELLDDSVTSLLRLNPDQSGADGDLVMDDDVGRIGSLLGFKKARPSVIWMDGQYSGIQSGTLTHHKAMARDIIVGGKSPGWVNMGIEIGIEALLTWVGTYLGVPGLSALYTGQLSDILLAYQRFTDKERARKAGPYLYHEHVVANGGSAYTVDAVMEGQSGLFDTRAYASREIKVRDASPYVFGRDYGIGHIVGYQLGEAIWTDYVSEAVYRDNREERSTWTVTIGDGSDEESDGQRAHRKIAALFGIAKDIATDAGQDLGLGVI